ncbi:hypothetical protein FRB96_003630 [Tulasnella sp. 330]|nr:hypothetical protein FRB96_003630 [Tulasnella sp. 330]
MTTVGLSRSSQLSNDEIEPAINTLAAELLGHIFHLAIYDIAPGQAILYEQGIETTSPQSIPPLLLVCKRWYFVLISTPSIWSTITTSLPPAKLERWLSRAKSAPLHVHLHVPLSSNRKALSHRIDQWHSMQITVTDAKLFALTKLGRRILLSLPSTLPSVKSIVSIIPSNAFNSIYSSNFTIRIKTPSLERLVVQGPIVYTHCTKLRHLRLTAVRTTYWNDFQDCLRSAEKLQSLEVHHVAGTLVDPAHMVGPLHAPSLTHLTLNAFNVMAVLAILSHLRAPALTTLYTSLELEFVWFTDTPSEPHHIDLLNLSYITAVYTVHSKNSSDWFETVQTLLYHSIPPGKRIEVQLAQAPYMAASTTGRTRSDDESREWIETNHDMFFIPWSDWRTEAM